MARIEINVSKNFSSKKVWPFKSLWGFTYFFKEYNYFGLNAMPLYTSASYYKTHHWPPVKWSFECKPLIHIV